MSSPASSILPPLPASLPISPSPPPQPLCPGDVVMALPETGVVRMGGGVRQEGEVLLATKAGLLRTARGGKVWVEARQRRYAPSPDDVVIGRIADKHAGGLASVGAAAWMVEGPGM